MSDKKFSTAGTWQSPITAASLATAGMRLAQPNMLGGRTFWLEGRPAEQGRVVLVEQLSDGAKKDLTPPPYDVRSRVHEYGGGAYTATSSRCFFVNAVDQGIYEITDEDIKCVFKKDNLRFADLLMDDESNRIIAVAEDHSPAGEPRNFLCAINLDNNRIVTLHEGADFYCSPTLDKTNRRLAWLSWMHPDMPWDQTSLQVASIADCGKLLDIKTVAHNEAVFQPQFGPDGRLYYVSDKDNWWNLYVSEQDKVNQLTFETAEFGMGHWIFGMSLYGLVDATTIIAARVQAGLWDAVTIDCHSGQIAKIKPWPYSDVEHLSVSEGHCIGLWGNETNEPAVISYDAKNNSFETLQRASTNRFDPQFVSGAQNIEYPTSFEMTAYGFFYAPKNPAFELPAGERPPLIITVHGGPTTATTAGLNPRYQFWTSRGFAILDVNYRGSTGFGRDYRKSLAGNWGIYDVDDCIAGAQHLISQGLVDENRIFIMGGSAGGYTVLCALAFSDFFNGGISSYGIGDLAVLIGDTHKFEARYTDSLIGPYDKDLYHQRSPLFFASDIQAPALFFQGTEDKVVPPNQTEDMVNALKNQRIPTAYVSMQGEGHGFRRSESIETMLNVSLSFLCRLMGCEPAEGLAAFDLYNEDYLEPLSSSR